MKSFFRKKKSNNTVKKFFNKVKKQDNDSYKSYYNYQKYISSLGQAVWSDRNYSKFAEEGYIKNVIAHRCINMIAKSAGSVPFLLFDVSEGTDKIVTNHQILKLLSKPNPFKAGQEFLEAIYYDKLISGNAFVQSINISDNFIAEIFNLRPDRVKIIPGKSGAPLGYEYNTGNYKKTFLVNKITGKSDIMHIKNYHPLDDWYGLSDIEAASYSIDQHNQANAWNQSLLQNGARPSGALIVKNPENGEGGYLTEEQYTRIKNQVDEVHSGYFNAGRPLLLEGGLDWKEMSLSPKDMDFINTKDSASRDIAQVFGVPPQLLGIPGDNTFSNLGEARLAFWEQTVLPLVQSVVDGFNHWLVPRFKGSYKISYNINSISALAPRRETIWKHVKGADFLTDEEKRSIIGL